MAFAFFLCGAGIFLEVTRTDSPITGIRRSRNRGEGSGKAWEIVQGMLMEHHSNLVADVILFFESPEVDHFGRWWQELEPASRVEMLSKARDLLWTDNLLMSMIDQASKSGESREAVANKTIAVFAPELYAVDALANDYTALAVLLKAVMAGKEHDYFKGDDERGEEQGDTGRDSPGTESVAARSGDGDAAEGSAGDVASTAPKSKAEAAADKESVNMMDSMRKTYRSVLLSSFMQKIILTYKANY